MGIGGKDTLDFSIECPSMDFVTQELECYQKGIECYENGLASEEEETEEVRKRREADEEEVTPVDARKQRSLPAVQDIPFIYDEDEEYYNSLVSQSRVRRGRGGAGRRPPKTGKSTNQASGEAGSDNPFEASEELVGAITPSPALDHSAADTVMMQSQQAVSH